MNYNIAHLDMINVVVALNVWSSSLANEYIQILCDNIAVVEELNYDRARDPALATCAHNIWLLAAIFKINLVLSHFERADNRANLFPNYIKPQIMLTNKMLNLQYG